MTSIPSESNIPRLSVDGRGMLFMVCFFSADLAGLSTSEPDQSTAFPEKIKNAKSFIALPWNSQTSQWNQSVRSLFFEHVSLDKTVHCPYNEHCSY